jgi:hypothetical protein
MWDVSWGGVVRKESCEGVLEIGRFVAFGLGVADTNGFGIDAVSAEAAAEPGFVDGVAVGKRKDCAERLCGWRS